MRGTGLNFVFCTNILSSGMKKFNFKLETVLKYRKILRDQQRARLALANAAMHETEALLDELDGQREEIYQSMVESAKEGFSLINHQVKDTFNQKIGQERSKEKIRLAKRRKAVEFEGKKLVKSAQEHKGLEKLKDQHKELHDKDCLSLEIKQIDDLVNSRFCQQE